MRSSLRYLASAVLVLSLTACHAPAQEQAEDTPMQLKLYQVPAQSSATLEHALRGTLGSNNHSNVTQPFPGALLVYAPRSAQASIGSTISALSKAADTSAKPQRLQVHFWLVDALPGAGSDAATLKPLSATLNTLRQSLGPTHFQLDETVTVATTPGAGFNSIDTQSGHKFDIHAESGSHGNLILDMHFENDRQGAIHSLHTTTHIRPGEYVVLARAPDAASTPSANGPSMRLLVVRVDRADSAG